MKRRSAVGGAGGVLCACAFFFLGLHGLWAEGPAWEKKMVVAGTLTTWDEMVRREAQTQGPFAAQEASEPEPPHMPGGSRDLPVPEGVTPPMEAGTGAVAVPEMGDGLPSPGAPALAAGFQAAPDNGTHIPPDTHGAVGPNHLVTVLNGTVRIQNRTGGLISNVTLATFWSSLSPNSPFDPKIIYDPNSSRFYFVTCANRRSATSAMLFAASATSDPTGAWYMWILDGDASNVNWVDYPNIGVNNLWVTFTSNMFAVSNDAFAGSNVWVVDKSTAMSGGPLTLTLMFQSGIPTLVPCMTYSNAENTQHLINTWNAGAGVLRLFRLTGTAGAPVWTATNFFPGSFAWSGNMPNAPQLGDARLIETNDDRMMNAELRNGFLWCTHAVGLPASAATRTGAKWWQINPATGAVIQTGVVQDTLGDLFYYFPSIAVNKYNEALLGFTASSEDIYASGAYTFRSPDDAPGTMQPVGLLKAGQAPYYKVFSGTSNRWGDYSATMVDPVDDASMWTIQEYAASPGNTWGTWWGKVTSQEAPQVVSISRASANPTNALNVAYTVTFSEMVQGVDADDFNLAVSGLTGAGISSVLPITPSATRTVTVNTGSGVGTLRLDFVDNDSVVDLEGNPVGGTGAGNGNLTGATYNVDHVPPTITLGGPSTPVSGDGAGVVDFAVTYGGASSVNLTAAKVSLTTTGDAAGDVSVLNGTTATPTIRVGAITGDGTLTVTVAAGGASDPAGNTDPGAGPATSVLIESPLLFVDFSAPNGGDGSVATPFNTLAEALAAAQPNSNIRILPGASGETLRIDQAARLKAHDGAVRIGD